MIEEKPITETTTQNRCLDKNYDVLPEDFNEHICSIKPVDYVDTADTEHSFMEMSAIGGGFCSIKLSVYGNEGSIPHFHFYKGIAPEKGIPQDVSGGGCICITTPKYFSHGSHEERLTRKEINGMIEFLKSPNKVVKDRTNWKHIIELWNENNPEQIQVDTEAEIPNYMADMPNYTEDFKNTDDIVSRK